MRFAGFTGAVSLMASLNTSLLLFLLGLSANSCLQELLAGVPAGTPNAAPCCSVTRSLTTRHLPETCPLLLFCNLLHLPPLALIALLGLIVLVVVVVVVVGCARLGIDRLPAAAGVGCPGGPSASCDWRKMDDKKDPDLDPAEMYKISQGGT